MDEKPKDFSPETYDSKGHPMTWATPRDVTYIVAGSFALVLLSALGVLGMISGARGMTLIAVVVAVGVVIAIVRAIRRQKSRGAGEAG